jgi:hypothetical protein
MNMGKSGAPAIREQLLALKKNLVYQLSVKKTEEDYSKEIRWCLEHQNTEAALEYAQKMTYEYMSYEYSMDIDRKINYLISLCGDLTTSFSVDEIQSNKMKYAGEAKEGHLDKEIPIEDLTFNKI